ncbi:MAG TPA: FAD-binding oxidoreductase, partial [Spirochaetia bacterium]|nr:FAD-binding oxidoreductase [Spirochaetia bacterium]
MSLSQRWLQEAQAVAPGRVVTDPALMEPYGHDESPVGTWQRLPEAVVKPADEAEVAAILRLCGQHGVPLTVRGAGTGLAAGCVPAPGGIVLSMELLNRVIEADPSNRTVTVQAGVTMKRLYEEVDRMSLYFPPHPGDEGAFVGGAA